MAAPGVAIRLARDPGRGLLPRAALGVIAHDLGIGEHGRHRVEIRKRHLAEDEPRSGEDLLHSAKPPGGCIEDLTGLL